MCLFVFVVVHDTDDDVNRLTAGTSPSPYQPSSTTTMTTAAAAAAEAEAVAGERRQPLLSDEDRQMVTCHLHVDCLLYTSPSPRD